MQLTSAALLSAHVTMLPYPLSVPIISQKRVQYNIAQTLYLWEKFSLYTLTKSVKIPSISNKLGTDFTVVRVPQIDPSVALFPV